MTNRNKGGTVMCAPFFHVFIKVILDIMIQVREDSENRLKETV